MYKARLLESTAADGDHGISKNATIDVPLKQLSNFWRILKIPLINYKIELKYKWTNYCESSAAGAENTNAKSNNIIFTIKGTK